MKVKDYFILIIKVYHKKNANNLIWYIQNQWCFEYEIETPFEKKWMKQMGDEYNVDGVHCTFYLRFSMENIYFKLF